MTIVEIRDWLNFLFEAGILFILIAEYQYDERKDLEKKQRRTRTTKKAVTAPDGTITTEENIETVESKGEQNAQ